VKKDLTSNKKSKKRLRTLLLSIFSIVIILSSGVLFYFLYYLPRQNIVHFTEVQTITLDGGYNLADSAVGIVFDEESDILFVTGFISTPGEGMNIWIGKYQSDFNLLVNTTFNGEGNNDDMGYTMVFDGNYLFIIGYVSEVGEDHNIWLAKYDTNLNLQKYITINGSGNSTDDGYGILLDSQNNLFIAGTVTSKDFGYDVYLAKYNKELVLQKEIIINGPANNTDKGRFLAEDEDGYLYVSGSMSQVGSNYDIWLGKFDKELNYLDHTIIAGPTTGEDKGYGLVLDETNRLYVIGTMTESGQGYNLWLGEFDNGLNLLNNITIDDAINGEDVGYSIMLEKDYFYLMGVFSEEVGNQNILIAKYSKSLELVSQITITSTGNNYDSGYGIIKGKENSIFVSGFITEILTGPDIWLGYYEI